MTEFFRAIEWLFEDILFWPLDQLRLLQNDSWFLANFINWIFVIIGIIAFAYWMNQLRIFDKEEKESERTRPNPFLG